MALKAYIQTLLIAELDDAGKSLIQLPMGIAGRPNRGIVEDCGPHVDPVLEPGTIVYYCSHDHEKIGNSTVVPAGCIMAFEEL